MDPSPTYHHPSERPLTIAPGRDLESRNGGVDVLDSLRTFPSLHRCFRVIHPALGKSRPAHQMVSGVCLRRIGEGRSCPNWEVPVEDNLVMAEGLVDVAGPFGLDGCVNALERGLEDTAELPRLAFGGGEVEGVGNA